ncbi:hypothetical protein H2199_003631 [Coniosporium tulheliwenetii]|uniref:Uncharacterized protein n=1 Tax=Coniosporium tulheliwenetii TaxID=3383036 RepID=A0ACC2ZAA1_9PEZI|nr:hypothetical protein H2199_003631 [Cladosporium sp. JES 115]
MPSPSPVAAVATVSIHTLAAGSLTLPERFFVQPVDDPDARKSVPSLSFLIHHESAAQVTRIVFDLGIRRDLQAYSPQICKHLATRQPVTSRPDVVQSLASGGLHPSDIDIIMLSHVHWDHIGTPSDFLHSLFVVGNGSLDLLSGRTKLENGSHSHFERGLLPLDRTIQLPDTSPGRPIETSEALRLRGRQVLLGPWHPFSSLPHTIDFFGDGSLYIVSAPGHLPGHINLLCRTAVDRYVYLAGDAYHDTRLLSGECEIAEWRDSERPDLVCCIHADRQQAKETINRIRALQRGETLLGPVEVVAAHDAVWAEVAAAKDRYWPGKL